MERRVTMRDIARKLGVHQTTVSLALRKDPRLPLPTRQRIQAAAREMGYVPDPVAKALAVYRTSLRPVQGYSTLAWISQGETPTFDQPNCPFVDYIKGARERAAEAGCRLEEFPCRAPGMTARRLSGILKNQGIRGVLVAPWALGTHRLRRLQLDWDAFSAVGFGHHLLWPNIPRVTPNQYRASRLLVRKLSAHSYRKIGLCVPKGQAEENWKAGFLMEAQVKGFPSPVLEYETVNLRKLTDWIRQNQLDAVIVPNHQSIFSHLRKTFRIPKELGMASMYVPSRKSAISGIYQNSTYAGARAVDFLLGLMRTNQRGIPECPERLLIECEWVEGNTVRRVGKVETFQKNL